MNRLKDRLFTVSVLSLTPDHITTSGKRIRGTIEDERLSTTVLPCSSRFYEFLFFHRSLVLYSSPVSTSTDSLVRCVCRTLEKGGDLRQDVLGTCVDTPGSLSVHDFSLFLGRPTLRVVVRETDILGTRRKFWFG